MNAAGAGAGRARARTIAKVGLAVVAAVGLWGTLLAVEGSGQTSGLDEHLSAAPTSTPPEPSGPQSVSLPVDILPYTCSLEDCRGADLEGDVSRLIYIKDVCLAEGTGGTRSIEFLIQRSAPFTHTASVRFATSARSAHAGSDFAARSGTITLAAGETRKTVRVPIVTDSSDESNEAFRLVLSNASGANLADRYGIGTILDDDGGPAGRCPDRSPLMRVQDACAVEADSGTTLIKFRVVRSGDLSGQSRMNWGSFDGSAVNPGDYVAKYGSHIFQTGQSVKSALVEIRGNTTPEPTKSFAFRLFNVESARAVREGTGRIVDDDGPQPGACGSTGGTGVRLSITDAQITEGDTGTRWLRFDVSLSAQSSRVVTVHFETTPGTAVRGSDYLFKQGTFTFQPGQTEKLTRIKIVGDTKPEANEQFTIRFSNPTNASIGDGTGVGRIIDDD